MTANKQFLPIKTAELRVIFAAKNIVHRELA